MMAESHLDVLVGAQVLLTVSVTLHFNISISDGVERVLSGLKLECCSHRDSLEAHEGI